MSSIPKPLIYTPPQDPLRIVFSDDDILVLSKPDGLLSVPGKGEHLADCLISRTRALFPGVLLVHRLDMDTSGLLVMALNREAQGKLGQQFEKRKTEKTYIARVGGHPRDDEGLVDLPLCCDWPNRPMQMVCHEQGRPSQTQWRVIAREEAYLNPAAPTPAPIKASLIALTPITGRSHQLRVHMRELGHPIVGDTLYAPPEIAYASPRMELHAQDLTLNHPRTGARMVFTDPCPFLGLGTGAGE